MEWPWKTYLRHSKQNGTIVLSHVGGGKWEVVVNGCRQTSIRYGLLWDDAFEHTKEYLEHPSVKTTLMLGLAAGGALGSIYRAFPNTDITVVEYDSEMIAIAKELKLYKPRPEPKILEMDAADAVKDFKGKGTTFDVVILDIFYGAQLSPLATDKHFLNDIKDILTPHGALVVNVSGHGDALGEIEKKFTYSDSWKYDLNHFGAFWDFN